MAVVVVVVVVARDAVEEGADAFLDRGDLSGGAFDLKDASFLVDVHFGARGTLHGYNGGTPSSNDNAHVHAQFHFRHQNLRVFPSGRFQPSRTPHPIAGPKFGLSIIGTRRQTMSRRMPHHIPNGHIMRKGYPCRRLFRISLGSNIPIQQCPIHTSRGKDRFIQWMPSNGRDLLEMSLETAQFAHGPNVIYFDELVATGRQEPISIVVPGHLCDGIFVSVQSTEGLSTGAGVP
eukprot:scaffold6592_cov53-Attheya_sp.AAC.1